MPGEQASEESVYGNFLTHDVYIFYAIAVIASLSRIIIRCTITRHLALEEVVMLSLICCYTAYIACVHVYLKYGTNMMTQSERFITLMNPKIHQDRIRGSKASIAAWFLYCTCIWGCKVCIWVVYKRLTDRGSTQGARVKYTGYLIAATYAAGIVTLFTMCVPFRFYWRVDPHPGRECSDGYHTLLVIGSLNILSDIPLLAIPIPIVVKLQVGWRQKAALFILFGVGICAVAAALGRMIEVSFSPLSGPSTFWALTETTCAFVITNVPGIHSAITFCRERRRQVRSTLRANAVLRANADLRAKAALRANTTNSGNLELQDTSRANNNYRQSLDVSLIHSDENLVIVPNAEATTLAKSIRADLTIAAEPVQCELAPPEYEETEGEGVGGSESFPDLEAGRQRPHAI